MRRLEALQWFGLLAAPLAWAVQLVFGFGAADANCSSGGTTWGIAVGPWEAGFTAGALVIALAAEASAALLYRELRSVEDDGPGPEGRLHFFAVAALIGNVIFLGAIALTAFGVFEHLGCQQS